VSESQRVVTWLRGSAPGRLAPQPPRAQRRTHSVVEEGAQRLSRNLVRRGWDLFTFEHRVAASRDGRCATSSTTDPATRWLRKARSACLETWWGVAGACSPSSIWSPRLVTVAARPPRRPTANPVVEEGAQRLSRNLVGRGWDLLTFEHRVTASR